MCTEKTRLIEEFSAAARALSRVAIENLHHLHEPGPGRTDYETARAKCTAAMDSLREHEIAHDGCAGVLSRAVGT